MKIFKRID